MANLVVLVMFNLSRFEEVLAAWHDAGAAAVTILEGMGTRAPEEIARRADLPMLPSIRNLLESDDAPRRIIFSVVRDDLTKPLAEATSTLMGDLAEPRNGIFFVVPVTEVLGLGRA